MLSSPPKIDLLPEHLIDQIKAGEVIERPGNLVKEILENAMDAGATKLELTLKNNGMDLIALKDNGHGMRFSDLPLAFSRHATSKISRFEDLYKLRSFGFRGEALASIAAISKLQCLSKTKDAKAPSELRIEGGETLFHGERQTASFEHGTELVIQDLFFNTPARLKFIQSQQSEKTFIRKIIFAFILARHEVEFQIKFDENEKDIFPARASLLERVQDIFPKAKDTILKTTRFYENNEIDLYLIPGSFKAPVRIQNIYINERYILDKQLHRVMTNGLMSTFGTDDFHYVAHFHLPPDSIDVNVHPNKTVIKVMETSKLISLLTSSIKELMVKPKEASIQHQTVEDLLAAPSFLNDAGELPILQQERHHYNMEGLFSPHGLPEPTNSDLIWMGQFLVKKNGSIWIAVNGPKLLELYTKSRLKMMASSIPLLVSEPFPAKGVRHEIMKELMDAGAEVEFLGKDTIVLRSIPDWMNGFPLKDVMACLLQESAFVEIQINPLDWSSSTWEEMLEFFPTDELITKKIACDLESLLREKLK